MIKKNKHVQPGCIKYVLSLMVLWIFAILFLFGCATTPEQDLQQDGSGQVNSGKAGADRLIVFVHGLNGHQWKTWDYEDGEKHFLWPQYMAEKDPDFKNADVFSFGYDSKCGANERIPTIAGGLEASLNKKLGTQDYASLSFVAHGMGGLVVREFILSHYDNLQKKVPLKNVVFLATPNGETDQKKLSHYFCKKPFSKKAQKGKKEKGPATKPQPAQVNYLESLNDRWRERFEQSDSRKPFLIAAAYEMVSLSDNDVLDRESAVAFAQQSSGFIKGHSNITKVVNPNDELYQWVKQMLLMQNPDSAGRLRTAREEWRARNIIGDRLEEWQGTELDPALGYLAKGDLDRVLALLIEHEKKRSGQFLKAARAHYAKAQIYELKRDFRNAQYHYLNALILVPGNLVYLNDTGIMTLKLGNYQEAEPIIREGLSIQEEAFGLDHPDVATSMANLATLFRARGRVVEAERLQKRALEIFEKAYGPDHPIVEETLNDLVNRYLKEGKTGKAEPLLVRLLAIRDTTLPPDHPDVVRTLEELAGYYYKQDRYEKAEPYIKRLLVIQERILDPDHPQIASSLNHLASLYFKQGRYKEAEPLFRKLLDIKEKALAHDHPHVAASQNHLANLYYKIGRYHEAEELYQKALATREKILGPDHLEVAQTLNNLGTLYSSQRRFREAQMLFERALAIREKAVGPEQTVVAQSLNSLAILYFKQSRYVEAEPLYLRANRIYEKALGPDHPYVATSLFNLANLYYKKSHYDKAEELYKRVLSIYEKALGPDHPHVAANLYNLGMLYTHQGKNEEAEVIFKRVLDIRKKAFGANHPDTKKALEKYVSVLKKVGKMKEAERLEAGIQVPAKMEAN